MANPEQRASLIDEIRRAAKRIEPYVRRTSAVRSDYYSERYGANVFLKQENLQETGSFKVRGALNKLLSLEASARDRGIVTASTGNHGAAVSWAARRIGARATVFSPESGDPGKLAAIERLGAELQSIPGDPLESERAARRAAEESGQTYVSPYNDRTVVAGQGTVGLEIAEQVPEVDLVLCSVGGGGLISGLATAVKEARPEARAIGVSPVNSAVMVQSIAAGEILDLPSEPTLSDGTAGGLEPDSVTFDLARGVVDRWETVSEEEISEALRRHLSVEHQLIEGAAAVPLAFLERGSVDLTDRTVVVVLCGANIGLDTLRRAIS